MTSRRTNRLEDARKALEDVVTDAADRAGRTSPVARDPVCGKSLKKSSKTPRYEYAGELWNFCSQACLNRFAEQPDIFTANPGHEGELATHDRALRSEEHQGELAKETPAVLEQSRVESGSG